MKITKHFIERYYERVLKCDSILHGENSTSAVLSDIMGNLSIHQKIAFDLFVGANVKKVFIPIGNKHRICLMNDCAVTVY